MYFDAAQDRLEQTSSVDFERAVEAARAGQIFAHDAKQYTRWLNSRRTASGRSRGLVGAELEAAVNRIAQLFPQQVIRGTSG